MKTPPLFPGRKLKLKSRLRRLLDRCLARWYAPPTELRNVNFVIREMKSRHKQELAVAVQKSVDLLGAAAVLDVEAPLPGEMYVVTYAIPARLVHECGSGDENEFLADIVARDIAGRIREVKFAGIIHETRRRHAGAHTPPWLP